VAGLRDGSEGIVVGLAARQRWYLGVEKIHHEASDLGLGLAALAEEDDVLSGKERVLDLGENGVFVTDDAGEERRACLETRDQVVPELLLDRFARVPARAQLADRAGLGHAHTMPWGPQPVNRGPRAEAGGSREGAH